MLGMLKWTKNTERGVRYQVLFFFFLVFAIGLYGTGSRTIPVSKPKVTAFYTSDINIVWFKIFTPAAGLAIDSRHGVSKVIRAAVVSDLALCIESAAAGKNTPINTASKGAAAWPRAKTRRQLLHHTAS